MTPSSVATACWTSWPNSKRLSPSKHDQSRLLVPTMRGAANRAPAFWSALASAARHRFSSIRRVRGKRCRAALANALQRLGPCSCMKPTRIIQRIIDEILASETLCVVGHIRPDGDCIGSQLALAMALQNQGKKVTCWNQDPMPRKLAFLDPDQLLQQPKPNSHFDCVIATDCASFER